MKIKTLVFGILLIGAVVCLVANSAWAGDVRGVSEREVKIGFLTDFTGPGKYAGPPLAMGAKIFMDYVNAKGGVNGRKIKLVVEDNGILPNTTLAAAKKLILKDEVFAIAFNLGSSGSSAITPLCEENEVVLMPHGANKRFYKPGNKWIFVPYATQFNMAARAMEYILTKNPKARVGMIYQDDDFGRDGLEGARTAAKFMNAKLVKVAPYKIGTTDLSPQVRMIKEANVDHVLLWTYLPQTGFVLKVKQKMGWDVTLVGNNTTAYPLMFPLIGESAHGYLCVTPFAPWEDISPKIKGIIKKYGDFEKVNKPFFPTGLVLGGWAYCAAMVEGLRNAGRNLTPQSLIKGLESIDNLKMGGMCPDMSFTSMRHCGYFSSMILKADANKKRFVIADPIKEPKSPQY